MLLLLVVLYLLRVPVIMLGLYWIAAKGMPHAKVGPVSSRDHDLPIAHANSKASLHTSCISAVFLVR